MNKEMRCMSQDNSFGTDCPTSPQSFHKDIAYDEIELGAVVGRGAFGIVHKALWKGIHVAVKIMEGEEAAKALNKEVHQLSKLRHENIIRLYGVCSQKTKVCLVMEYADNGSLYDILHPSSPDIKQCDYSIGHVMGWALQCAKAMEYLHGLKPTPIIHRDLKPPNMLLKEQGTVLKICDFGTARPQDTSHMTSNKGSAAWMAPEVFEGPEYSEKCDVFSFGIVLWEMITRRKPFDDIGAPPFRIMWAVHSGTRPPLIRGIPKIFEHLMICAWSKDSNIRPPFSAIVVFLEKASKFVSGFNAPLEMEVDTNEDIDYFASTESGSYCDTAKEQYLSTDSAENVSITDKDTVYFKASNSEKSPLLTEQEKSLTVKQLDSNRPLSSPEPSGKTSLSPTRTVEEERLDPGQKTSPMIKDTSGIYLAKSPGHQSLDAPDNPGLYRPPYSPNYTEAPDYNDPNFRQNIQRVSPKLHGYSSTNPNDAFVQSQDYLVAMRYTTLNHTYEPGHERPYPQYPVRHPFPPPNYNHGLQTPSPVNTPHGYHQPPWTNRWYSPAIPEHSTIDDIDAHHFQSLSEPHLNDNVFLKSSGGNLSGHPGGRTSLDVSNSSSNRSSGTSSPVSSAFTQPIRSEMSPENMSPMSQRIFQTKPMGYETPRIGPSAIDIHYEENLWHLMDPDIMPLRPFQSSNDSLRIHENHSRLIHEYIALQKDIEYLLQRKREIEQRLEDERMEQQKSSLYLEEYLKLLEEKQSLSAFLSTLKQELQQMNSFRGTGENVL